MDCRRALRLACLLLSPGLAAGCTPLMQQTVNPPPPAVAQVKKEKDLPKITPKAANCVARAGRLDEALALFRQTVGEAQAQYNLARMLHHMNRDDLSRQYLESALRADPQLTEARDLLVQLGSQPGRTAAQ